MKKFTLAAFIAAASIIGSNRLLAQGIIRTIAGTGLSTSLLGDGGAASLASLSSPNGVAVDRYGNIYIADEFHYVVRKIDGASGIISTIAGTGTVGFSGMGGDATSAAIHLPVGIFIDTANNLQITDLYNDIIFKVDLSTNIITNYCGNGSQGSGGDGGESDLAQLEVPNGSCSDYAGNMYIADNGNNRIRMVTPAGGIYTVNTVSTIANGAGTYGYSGDGSLAIGARFSGIGGVFIDPSVQTDLYVADPMNNIIRKIDLETGIVTLVAGTPLVAGYSGDGGPALSAKFNSPGNMFIDAYRNLYVCDLYDNVVRKINLNTGIITTVAGNGTMGFSGDGGDALSAQLAYPKGVWVDNIGNVFIADRDNNRIREITYPTIIEVGGPTATAVDPSTTAHGSSGGASVASLDMANVTSTINAAIFPNPSKGIFNLNLSPNLLGGEINITNVVGIKVYNATVTDQKSVIDLTNMASGIYTLTLRSKLGIYTQKLTVAK